MEVYLSSTVLPPVGLYHEVNNCHDIYHTQCCCDPGNTRFDIHCTVCVSCDQLHADKWRSDASRLIASPPLHLVGCEIQGLWRPAWHHVALPGDLPFDESTVLKKQKKKALESQLHASGVQWTPGMLNVPCASSLIFFPSTTNLKSSKFDDNVGGFQVEELENFQICMP